ncbi:hypothetical protein B0T19DRAFT_397499 [Cercophora scortea]|uniref:Uncharacterized protein n=1 Tax=Cercophora scortea TaxID=314031 RepID=A0AAE0IUQ8_9PEZI|nr:hypothetical protein B0T19DRAFT_397499 [Cercophora scortea]
MEGPPPPPPPPRPATTVTHEKTVEEPGKDNEPRDAREPSPKAQEKVGPESSDICNDTAMVEQFRAVAKAALNDVEHITFRDCFRRKFVFPWESVKAWVISCGRFDLFEPTIGFVLPTYWSTLVRPGMLLWMRMHDPNAINRGLGVPPTAPGFTGQGQPQSPSMGLGSTGNISRPPLHPSGFFGRPGPPFRRTPDIVEVAPSKRARGRVLGWVVDSSATSKNRRNTRSRSRGSDSSGTGSSSTSSQSDSSATSSTDTDSEQDPSGAERKKLVRRGLVFSTKFNKHNVVDLLKPGMNRQYTFDMELHVEGGKRRKPNLSSFDIISANRLAHGISDVEKGGASVQLVYRPKKILDSLNGSVDGDIIMRWHHIKQRYMDFDLFSHYASSYLSTDSNRMFSIIRSLLDRVQRDKLRRTDYGCYIEPGTILRWDSSGDDASQYAIFAAVPYFYVDHVHGSTAEKQNLKAGSICPPWRLHQSFSPFDPSIQRDEEQAFRKYQGKKGNQILWIGQLWVLITNSGFLTYGDMSHNSDLLLGDSIKTEMEKPQAALGERTVEFMDVQRQMFYISLDRCRTFVKLQSTIIDELTKAYAEPDIGWDWQLATSEQKELTAASWQIMVKDEKNRVLRVTFLQPKKGFKKRRMGAGSSSSSLGGSYDDTDSDSSDADSVQLVDTKQPDECFFVRASGEMKNRGNDKEEKSWVDPDVINSAWPEDRKGQKENTAGKNDDHVKILAESLEHVGLAMNSATHNTVLPGFFVGSLSQDESDILHHYHETPSVSYDELCRRANLTGLPEATMPILTESQGQTGVLLPTNMTKGRPVSLVIAEQILQTSIQVLEFFAPKDSSSPVTGKLRGGLLSILEVATNNDPATGSSDSSGTLVQYSSVSTAAAAGPSNHTSPDNGTLKAEWVIERSGPKELQPEMGYCKACEDGKVYKTEDAAIDHLRKEHDLKFPSREQLRKQFLKPLSEAMRERQKAEKLKLLRLCRDQMLRIANRASALQAGVTSDEGFRSPGLPLALIVAFEMIVFFLCSVGHSLRHLDKTIEEHIASSEQLSGLKIPDLIRMLEETLANKAEEQVLKANRLIITSARTGSAGDAVHYSKRVGPEPVHGGMDVAGLYQGYIDKQRSELLTHTPNRKRLRTILALADETTALATLTKPQANATVARKILHKLEHPLLHSQSQLLHLHHTALTKLATRDCKATEKTILLCAETTKDEQSRAILLFTIATVVFLPLSFVASYLGMSQSGGEIIADGWAGNEGGNGDVKRGGEGEGEKVYNLMKII